MDLDAYLEVRDRLIPIVSGSDPEVAVPACPGWRVRDVVAHLTGLCEDWVEGRLEGYASDSWTASQVERYSEWSVAGIITRWRDLSDQFAALGEDPLMGPPSRWAFGDAVIHEADVRGSLMAGRVPQDAVLLALKGSIGRWRHTLQPSEVPSLHLRTVEDRDWWLGDADDPYAAEVEAPLYEVFRALAGRRSEAQVRAWTWSRDPGPYLSVGPPYPFRWSSADLRD